MALEKFPARLPLEQIERYEELVEFIDKQPWAKVRFRHHNKSTLNSEVGREIWALGLKALWFEALMSKKHTDKHFEMYKQHLDSIDLVTSVVGKRLSNQNAGDALFDDVWLKLRSVLQKSHDKQTALLNEFFIELSEVMCDEVERQGALETKQKLLKYLEKLKTYSGTPKS